jgi:hypothetical protein
LQQRLEGGVAAKLADVMIASLRSHFKQLADEDVRTLMELYTAGMSAAQTTAEAVESPKVPAILTEQELCRTLSPFEVGGDEANGYHTTSISAVVVEKGAFSSLEDDSPIHESPCGDECTILVELLVDDSLPVWRKFA